MTIYFTFLYSLAACVFIANPLRAIDSIDTQKTKHLRILELLPNLVHPLPVEPAIPADFIALSPTGNLDLYDWVYWGPKDVLMAYFKDPASLEIPILRVALSSNVVQTGANSFNNEESTKILRKNDPDGFASIDIEWGNYPVHALRTQIEGYLLFMAWVGLNDPEAGWTLKFNLIYPNKDGQPSREDRELWKNLIMNTTLLKDGDYFKACGQDLQEGYTLVNVGGIKLKMLAEKRLRDGILQVVVIPENSNTKFNYVDMMECAMGATWKFAKPMVKVYGEIVCKDGNTENHIDHVTSIFFKSVEDFSFKRENENTLLIFQKN
ncbi:MAG: hypothetical protein H0X51_06660 [Parachlamydiaceae bacterium]|nr:hypothetical protein [Parachlamydiaceae bacterium]